MIQLKFNKKKKKRIVLSFQESIIQTSTTKNRRSKKIEGNIKIQRGKSKKVRPLDESLDQKSNPHEEAARRKIDGCLQIQRMATRNYLYMNRFKDNHQLIVAFRDYSILILTHTHLFKINDKITFKIINFFLNVFLLKGIISQQMIKVS